MISFFKKNVNTEEKNLQQRKLLEFSDAIAELKRDMKEIKDSLEKMEIKVLESRKVYQRKLKNLVGDEQEEEMQEAKSINNPVILPYNGFVK
jgi:hypothetical protein